MSTNITQSTIGVKENVNMVQDIALEATLQEIVLPKIEYDYNSAELRKESKEALDALISVLIENPNVVIQLRSHSDNRAGDDFNMELSQEELKFVLIIWLIKILRQCD